MLNISLTFRPMIDLTLKNQKDNNKMKNSKCLELKRLRNVLFTMHTVAWLLHLFAI